MTQKTQLRNSEYLFAYHKGHFIVSASRWEQRMPDKHLLEVSARILLNVWREHRERVFRSMKDSLGAKAVGKLNIVEFGDPIGPTEDYFKSLDESEVSAWATQLIRRAVALNGAAALRSLADERRDALAWPNLLPTQLQPFAEQVLRFEPTNNLRWPWRVETSDFRIDIGVNLFPDELLYTANVEGKDYGRFNNWPRAWKRLDR